MHIYGLLHMNFNNGMWVILEKKLGVIYTIFLIAYANSNLDIGLRVTVEYFHDGKARYFRYLFK